VQSRVDVLFYPRISLDCSSKGNDFSQRGLEVINYTKKIVKLKIMIGGHEKVLKRGADCHGIRLGIPYENQHAVRLYFFKFSKFSTLIC